MSDITHGDWCPYDEPTTEWCARCEADFEKEARWWRSYFGASIGAGRLGREEILDAYSDEPSKRVVMERELDDEDRRSR